MHLAIPSHRTPSQGRQAVPPAVLHRRPVDRCRQQADHSGDQSRNRRGDRQRAENGGGRDQTRDRGRGQSAAGMARQACEGARSDLAQVVRADAGQPGRPGAAHDHGAGQALAEAKGEIAYAASFIEWFAEEGKRIYGDVIPTVWPDRRLVVIKQPVGVCGAITPVELPRGDDHAQGRARACRWLHRGGQAGDADAVLGVGAGRARRARRCSQRRAQRADRQRQGHRRRADKQSDGAQDHVHRFHRGGSRAHAAERAARSRRSRWSSAATPRFWCSTTPIWTRRWKAR